MMYPARMVRYGFALSACMVVPVQAAQDPGVFRLVKQNTASELKRFVPILADQNSVLPVKSAPTPERSLDRGMDPVAEPRLMHALATLPAMPRNEGQDLPETVDPAMVRSWAEFMDPAMVLGWYAFAQSSGFAQALLKRPDVGGRGTKPPIAANPSYNRGMPWVNTGLSIPWSNVVSEGEKRALSGRQALQEWLMLPMPEPKSNPWLSNLGSYRY